MPKEIIVSKDPDPESSKYLTWSLDETECQLLKAAIGPQEKTYPLLTTLSDFYEDFWCPREKLLILCQETIELEINLEEHHRETPILIKLLTLFGGLAALAHDNGLCILGYAE